MSKTIELIACHFERADTTILLVVPDLMPRVNKEIRLFVLAFFPLWEKS